MKSMIFSPLSLPAVLLTAITIVFYLTGLFHLAGVFLQWKRISQLRYQSLEKNQIPVTVIVCAHNELTNLQKNLPPILNQQNSTFEVLIGLDRCDDGSKEWLQRQSHPHLKWIAIDQTPKGWDSKKYALNQCIQRAASDWLLLTDADCVPVSDYWLQSFQSLFAAHINLVIGLGPYHATHNFISKITEYETLLTATQYVSEVVAGRPYMAIGRNVAYRKSLFQEVAGFDGIQHITGGDDDLLIQKMDSIARPAVNIHPKSLTYSEPERTWKKYLTQKTRHLSVGKHYKEKFQKRLSFHSGIHSSLWLSCLYLIGFSDNLWRIIVPFALLVLIKGLFFKKIASKTGLPLRVAWYPLMDLMYAIFLPLVAIRAMLERNIRWKK